MLGLDIRLGLTKAIRGVPGIPRLTMSGLASGDAQPGSHASISVGFPSGVSSWSSQTWGLTFGDDTFGTGANPTDFTASDGGILYWQGVGNNDLTYRAAALIRYAAGTAPDVADQLGWTVGTAITPINAAASGANLIFTYQADLPLGLSINSSGQISGTPQSAGSGGTIVTASDQYGRLYQDSFLWLIASGETTFALVDGQIVQTRNAVVPPSTFALVNGQIIQVAA